MRSTLALHGPFGMLLPLLLWGAHLLSVYVLLSLACAGAPDAAWILPVLWLATLLVLALLAATGYAQRRQRRLAMETATRALSLKAGLLLTLLALVAVLWTALPLLFIAPCA